MAPRNSTSIESTLRNGTLYMRLGMTPRRWVEVEMVRTTGWRNAAPVDVKPPPGVRNGEAWPPVLVRGRSGAPERSAFGSGRSRLGRPVGTGCSYHTSRLSGPMTLTKRHKLSVSMFMFTAHNTTVRV